MTEAVLDPERQRKAKEYARIRHRLLLADLAIAAVYVLVLLLSGLSAWFKVQLLLVSPQPLVVIALYFVAFSIVYGLFDFPLSYYGGYVLPHRYGLSTQSPGGWLADQAKGAALGLGMGLVAMEVMYYLLRAFPSIWWLLTGILFLFFIIVLANLAPLLIVPLFFKFRPLEDEELVSRLISLAERAGTRVRGVFTIDLSTRTTAANAALMGLGNTRRIVVGDTLMEKYDPDEIETILAHELGHHVHGDIWRGIVVQTALTLIGLFLADRLLRWGVAYFAFEGLADVAAFPLVAIAMGGLAVLAMPLANAYARWREGLADQFSLEMTSKPQAFISSMTKLANQNLSEAEPEPWAEFLLYSHPAIGKRIKRAQGFKSSLAEESSLNSL
ncbi:MAG: M48 family peptidase [Anaerolineales bacterium]|nr:MAG: M48 family peptidase [Anaerolineales bacterium]